MIIYGCTQGYYCQLEMVASCPDWLSKSLFKVKPDEEEDAPTREQHNRDVFLLM